jgi:hypothetical protein
MEKISVEISLDIIEESICYPDLSRKELYQKCLVQTCHGEKFHREIIWGMNGY